MKLLIGGMVAACLCLLAPQIAFAQSQDSSVTVSAVVPGQPPDTAPLIESPTSGISFQQKQIDVTGTCATGLVVKVFRNEIFAGSSLCQADGTFSLQIDLIDDRNDLVARQYDLLSQSSPASEMVQVFYTAVQPDLSRQTTSQTARFQLVIDYDYNFQGIFVKEGFNLPVHFAGGTPPYAVSIDWGDGETKVYSREDASQFHAEHIFGEAGPRTVKIHVSDKEGQEASLQFVLIVNGGPVAALPIKSGEAEADQDIWNAVVYTSLATGAASFTAGFLLASFWETMRLRIHIPKIKPPKM